MRVALFLCGLVCSVLAPVCLLHSPFSDRWFIAFLVSLWGAFVSFYAALEDTP